jgi:AcrR family transcriptional regulator
VGYRHSEGDILAAAIAVAKQVGMAGLTFKAVGEHLGISDRTVVYYFASKSDLIVAVAQAMGADLEKLLEEAFGTTPREQSEMVKRAWPVLTTSSADQVFSLFFEIVGLASARQAPYDVLAPFMMEAWVQWLTPRMIGTTANVRRQRALATTAQIDGLLLIRRLLGAEVGDVAAREATKR